MAYIIEYQYGADGMLLTSTSITDGIDGYIESVIQYTYDVSGKDWEKRFYEDRYRGTVITERTIEYW